MSSRLLGRRAHRGIKLAAIAAAPICIGGFAQHAKADIIIGVQFYNNGTGASLSTAPSSALTASEVAGVPSDPNLPSTTPYAANSALQDNWNTQGAASPGTLASGSIAASSLVDNTGSANALSAAFTWQSGDSGGTHKGGVYNDIIPGSIANPNGAGYYQSSLLGGGLTNNSSSTSSVAEFTNVPTSGYTYELVAYTEMYGTTVMRLTVGGITGSGTAPTTGLVPGQAGGYGTNPITGTDNLYVTQQAGGGASASQMNTAGVTNATFDGSSFFSNPVTFGSAAPTSASNYVVWTNVTPDASGNIQLEWNKYSTGITTNTNITAEGINAIQLIATPSAVPEPASLGLLVLGSTSLLMRRRKNSAKA